jgi:23S rRNA G2445 N2-methylase RlmL
MDGFAALAAVLEVDRRSRLRPRLGHPLAREVAAAGIAAIKRTSGVDVAEQRLAAAISRTSRIATRFHADVAATYAEMDDEFRQIVKADDERQP